MLACSRRRYFASRVRVFFFFFLLIFLLEERVPGSQKFLRISSTLLRGLQNIKVVKVFKTTLLRQANAAKAKHTSQKAHKNRNYWIYTPKVTEKFVQRKNFIFK